MQRVHLVAGSGKPWKPGDMIPIPQPGGTPFAFKTLTIPKTAGGILRGFWRKVRGHGSRPSCEFTHPDRHVTPVSTHNECAPIPRPPRRRDRGGRTAGRAPADYPNARNPFRSPSGSPPGIISSTAWCVCSHTGKARSSNSCPSWVNVKIRLRLSEGSCDT